MKSEWENVVLGDICKFHAGNAFPKKEQGISRGDIPFIKVSDMNSSKNQRKIYKSNNWISRKTALRMKLNLAPNGAVVFAKIGEALKAERLRILIQDTAIDNNMMAAIPKQNIEHDFLLFILEYIHLARFAEGSALPYLRQYDLENIPVTIPSRDIQKNIVKILSVLDDKIELNWNINDNLAELLQALYQQQFCCSNCTDNQGRLADLCDYSKAKVAVTELSLSTYYSTENMLPGKAGAVDAANLPTTTQVIKCQIGDVLISNIRPYFKKIVYCHSNCGCSMDVLCFTPKLSQLSAYLYSVLYADSFFDFMVAGSKGTKMPRGDKQQIMTYAVHIPTKEEIKVFNALAMPILEQIENTHRENMRLSSLRDSLLPKLMSGELDVSELDI